MHAEYVSLVLYTFGFLHGVICLDYSPPKNEKSLRNVFNLHQTVLIRVHYRLIKELSLLGVVIIG